MDNDSYPKDWTFDHGLKWWNVFAYHRNEELQKLLTIYPLYLICIDPQRIKWRVEKRMLDLSHLNMLISRTWQYWCRLNKQSKNFCLVTTLAGYNGRRWRLCYSSEYSWRKYLTIGLSRTATSSSVELITHKAYSKSNWRDFWVSHSVGDRTNFIDEASRKGNQINVERL